VWWEVGTDLARLHRSADPASPVAGLVCEDLPDAGGMADRLAERGAVGGVDAQWLRRWLGRLDEAAGGRPTTFVHCDIQSTNVMLADGRYLALLDWGACGWSDPADDFAGIPMRAVPAMLAGYRSAGGAVDEPLQAAIVRRQLQVGLFLAQRSPEPDLSWAERPLGALVDLLRFFATAPAE
jgi:aminoglycoside phosphotransferase (APT) family kinase protein